MERIRNAVIRTRGLKGRERNVEDGRKKMRGGDEKMYSEHTEKKKTQLEHKLTYTVSALISVHMALESKLDKNSLPQDARPHLGYHGSHSRGSPSNH